MKNVVLIDADSLAFMGKSTDSIQDIILKVDEKINNILDICQADYYCLFVSQGKYFRHDLKDKSEESGRYKSNRKYSNQNYNRVIKEYLIAQYGAVSSPNVEADDVIAYWINKTIMWATNLDGIPFLFDSRSLILTEDTEKCNIILSAVDKDLLQSIPGKHLNYNKKLGADEWGMEWVETSESEAVNFKRMQMVVGDNSDGIISLKGKGIKYWEKLSAEILPSWGEILQLYCVDYGVSQGIYEFQKNYRLLHLLDCDEDFLREVGYVPTLPNFKEVTKQNIEIKNEF